MNLIVKLPFSEPRRRLLISCQAHKSSRLARAGIGGGSSAGTGLAARASPRPLRHNWSAASAPA